MSVCIKRTKSNLHRIENTLFQPGNNIVSDGEFKKLQKSKGFQDQLNGGALVVQTGMNEAGKAENDVVEMNQADTIKAVKELFNIDQLNELKITEMAKEKVRPKVILAIDAQIKVVEVPKTDGNND